MRNTVVWSFALAVLAACSTPPTSPAVPCGDASVPTIDCIAAGTCAQLSIAGDTPDVNAGIFKGFADPSIARDPTTPNRVWLAYSRPFVVAGQAADGATVQLAAVSTRLARSDDSGATFTYVGELESSNAAADPEGSGEMGRLSAETESIVPIESGGTVTWYHAYLRYFLRPVMGYNPKYATGWTVRVASATSPTGLGDAAESIIGVSQTAAAYQVTARVDQLAGLPITRCAMLNNPSLIANNGTLYLTVECLAFSGTALDHTNSTTQVLATVPTGPASSWTWRYVGTLADRALATELGQDTIQQPELARAADGSFMMLVAPAADDSTVQVGTRPEGCVAIALDSIDPPKLARDCNGRVIRRASLVGTGFGACSYDSSSMTGILATAQTGTGGNWTLHRSGLRP